MLSIQKEFFKSFLIILKLYVLIKYPENSTDITYTYTIKLNKYKCM